MVDAPDGDLAAPLLPSDDEAEALSHDDDDDDNDDDHHATSDEEKRPWTLRRVVLGEKVWLSMGCIALLIRLPFSIASPYFLAATVSRLKDGDAHGVWRNLVYLGAVGVVDAALDFWCVFLFSYTKSRIVKVSQTPCVPYPSILPSTRLTPSAAPTLQDAPARALRNAPRARGGVLR